MFVSECVCARYSPQARDFRDGRWGGYGEQQPDETSAPPSPPWWPGVRRREEPGSSGTFHRRQSTVRRASAGLHGTDPGPTCRQASIGTVDCRARGRGTPTPRCPRPARPEEVIPLPTALVTGAPEWVPHVAIALKSEGFDIVSAAEEAPLAPGSLDCYVQLPGGVPTSEGSALSRARSVVADDLLARVDVVTRLAPSMAPHAVVLLVGEEPLRWLLEMLAEAIVSEASGVEAKVVGGSRPPSEIAALARTNGHRRSWRSYLDEEPELGFADWRDEVICLTSSAG